MKALLALLLAGLVLSAQAADRLDAFGYAMPIETGAADALQRLEIPRAAYEGSVRPHLADLRVFNALGETVPHAFVPRAAPDAAQAKAVPLRFFPLHGSRDSSAQELVIVTERTANGSVVRVRSGQDGARRGAVVVGYLVDAGERKPALQTLELDWKPAGNGFSGSLRVEGSDDLSSWTTLVSAAPLLSLEFGGQRLEQKSVELHTARQRYLRLSWPAGQPPLALTALTGRPGTTQVEPSRRWKALDVTAGRKAGEYRFDLGGRLPLDRLRIGLPEANTLVAVEILSREREEDAWQVVARAVVYRLTRDGIETWSPPIAVHGSARYWMLRVDQKGGGIGAGLPKLEAGWVPEQLVFVARGTPPFQLAYGNAQAQAAAYPIDSVVPGWRSDEPLRAAQARVGEPRAMAGPSALHARPDYKTWMLWAALAAGVAILAWMAWQLSKQLKDGGTA